MQIKKQQLELGMEQQTGSKLGKEYPQGYISSPCLFNFHVEYIMRNAILNKSQAEIEIVGGNINNFRYADDTTLMAESEEKLKSLWIKMKEQSEKAVLKQSWEIMKDREALGPAVLGVAKSWTGVSK